MTVTLDLFLICEPVMKNKNTSPCLMGQTAVSPINRESFLDKQSPHAFILLKG